MLADFSSRAEKFIDRIQIAITNTMKTSPIVQTAIMGLAALVLSIVAASFFPWPESFAKSDLVGKPLFEGFEAKNVRTIQITEYDVERNGLKQIELRRNGELWVIPKKENFIANNPNQISMAINSVNANVLEQRSDELQNHVEFGVVDPQEFESTASKKSLGRKLVLLDQNNREMASLIVGGSPRDDANAQQSRRFVRITGKPNVYVAEIPATAVSAEFPRWVNLNLMNLTTQSDLKQVTINHFRCSPEQLAKGDKTWNYRLVIDAVANSANMFFPDAKGELKPGELPKSDFNIQSIGMFIGNLVFNDIKKKPGGLISLLKNPAAEMSEDLKSLNQSGFSVVEKKSNVDFGFQFLSTGGSVAVQLADGVLVNIIIGNLTDAQPGTSDLNRLVMLYASVDEAFFPVAEKPAVNDENEEKKYLRLVAERESKLKEARSRAQSLNDSYADWFYVVPEPVVDALLPEYRSPISAEPSKGDVPKGDADAAKAEAAKADAPKTDGANEEKNKEGKAGK